jgi:nitroreductase
MTPILPTVLIDALKWRYATQKFDPAKKIPEAMWAALEEALVLAPSTFGLQPWKFVIAQDPAMREALAAAAWGQRQPVDCSHFVVFALRQNLDADHVDRYIERLVEVRGGSKDEHGRLRDAMVRSADQARTSGNLDEWMSRQVYIALGQFMTAAALLGVDTCPMEGLKPARFDEILGLAAQGYTTLCACAAGYRSADDKYADTRKVRFKAGDVLAYP